MCSVISERERQKNGRRVALGLMSRQAVSQLFFFREKSVRLIVARPSRRTETDLDIIMSRMKVRPPRISPAISLPPCRPDDGGVREIPGDSSTRAESSCTLRHTPRQYHT